MRRLQDRVEPLPARARMERDARAVREDPVHREPRAVEVVARRREDDEVQARRRLVALAIHVGARAPEERVVERVEVGPLRHRRSLRIEDSVVPGHVGLQAGGRLHDRAVPDRVVTLGLLLDGLGPSDVLRVLRNRLRPVLHVEARLERRRDALGEVEVQVPRLDVLEEVREVHRRSAEEVAARETGRCIRAASRSSRSRAGRARPSAWR